MDAREAYNRWAQQYDTDANRTRDLEAAALRETLAAVRPRHCLEIGCGTGKNTVWILERAEDLVAVDFSEEMLMIAKQKIRSEKVTFRLADIREAWTFAGRLFDLVVFSLVLEHIENTGDMISKAAAVTAAGGYIYIGELHPFKQYLGSKARFETAEGEQVVACFNHHISDFTRAAETCGLEIAALREFFDDDNRNGIPRILTLLLRKK